MEVNWNPPAECGASCNYTILYEAPALECRNVTSDELSLITDGMPMQYPITSYDYITNTSLVRTGSIDVPGFYNFTMKYANATEIGTIQTNGDAFEDYPTAVGGATCAFRNATYKVTFEFANNTRVVGTKIQNYTNYLGNQSQQCFGDIFPGTNGNHTGTIHVSQGNNTGITDCLVYTVNTRATCEAFTTAFGGNVSDFYDTSRVNALVLEQLFNITLPTWDEQLGFYQADYNASISLKVSSLSQALEDLFSNITLSIMTVRSDTTTVRVDTWDGKSVWTYDPRAPWSVYGTAIGIVFAIGIYGLYCLHSNGIEMDSSFSQFLITTRNGELDVMVGGAGGAGALREIKLLWKDGIFIIDPEHVIELERFHSK